MIRSCNDNNKRTHSASSLAQRKRPKLDETKRLQPTRNLEAAQERMAAPATKVTTKTKRSSATKIARFQL